MLKRIYLLLAVCLLLTSCNGKFDLSDSNTAAYPLDITTGSGAMQSSWVTKATTPYNTKDSTLSVSRLADVTAGLSASSNVKYVFGTVWGPASGVGSMVAAATTQVCAYAPYNKTYTDITKLPLNAWMGLGSGSSAARELYYSAAVTGSVGSGKSSISFTLNRAYVLLRFTLSGMSTFTGAGNVTDFSIYNKNLPQSNTLNIASSTATYGTLVANPTYRMTYSVLSKGSFINKNLSTSPVIEVLLPPCTLYDATNKTLDATITVDGVQRFIRLDLTANGMSGALIGGNCYDIGVSLNPGVVAESNCYMVKPGSTIFIPVSRAVKGNAAAGYVTAGGTPLFKTGDPFSADVLWSDKSPSNVSATAVGQYIKVTAGGTEGNSVVYALSGGKIVWSWHIWVTSYVPTVTVKPGVPSATGGTIPYYGNQYWLDRNLGATTSTPNTQTTLGMMYQWGRKDPFPPASSATVNTTTGQTINLPQSISNYPEDATALVKDPNMRYKSFAAPITATNASSYSIQYPLMFIGNGWAGSTASAAADGTTAAGGIYSWCASDSKKTFFDPCPLGWRVPYFSGTPSSYATSPWNSLGTSGSGYVGGVSSWLNNGMTVSSPAAAVTYYPASGCRSYGDGALYVVGSYGYYWSGSVDTSNGSGMYFNGSYMNAFVSSFRAYGFGLRCVQE